MDKDVSGWERVVLDNIFTSASEWDVVQRVVGYACEAGRQWQRNRFSFLDARVQQKLQDAHQGCDLPVDLPDGPAWGITRLQALFQHPLAQLTADCPPENMDQRLARALKTHIKSQSTGTWIVRSERASALGATLRVRWLHDARRRAYTHSVLLLEFRQYDAVPTAALQQIATIPACDDTASDEDQRAWEAAYGQAAAQARTLSQRLATPLKAITIAVWPGSAPVPRWRYRTSQPDKSLDEQRGELWEAYCKVRKDRLAIGNDTQHWKWMYAQPQLATNDITFLVLLYLLQERMIELTGEIAPFLTRYVRKFRGGREGWEKLVGHMRLHVVLPEDWKVLCRYIRKTLQGFQKTERQSKRRETYTAKYLARPEDTTSEGPGDRGIGVTHGDRALTQGNGSQLVTVPEAVYLLANRGLSVSQRTLYNWARQGKLPYVIDAGERKLTPDGLQHAAVLAKPRHQRKALRDYVAGKRDIQAASAKRDLGRRPRRGATLETITRDLLSSTNQEDNDARTA